MYQKIGRVLIAKTYNYIDFVFELIIVTHPLLCCMFEKYIYTKVCC